MRPNVGPEVLYSSRGTSKGWSFRFGVTLVRTIFFLEGELCIYTCIDIYIYTNSTPVFEKMLVLALGRVGTSVGDDGRSVGTGSSLGDCVAALGAGLPGTGSQL